MRPSRWITFLPFIGFIVLVAALAIAVRHTGTNTNKFNLHINEPAPTTTLGAFGNSTSGFTTSDWLGRPYIVNFFASWCVPCHAEHDNLLSLTNHYHLPIIGIGFKDKANSIKSFLKNDGNPFISVAADMSGKTGIEWGITGVPETFVIDNKGIIRLHIAGPLTDEIIQNQLLPLWNTLKN
jgi:cytochrome c biogenesis protein CcmG/thiol:disulfide interchange protein DsbE